MRILFWLNSYLPDLGGIQTLCAELVPELERRGHDVLVLSGIGLPAPESEVLDGVRVRRVNSIRAVFDKDPRAVLTCGANIRSVLNDFDPELIHLHPSGPEMVFYLQQQRRRHIPTVLTVHNNHSSREVDCGEDSTFGKAMAVADRVTTVSGDARDWLVELTPGLSPKTTVVLNGIPVATTEAAPLPWEPPTLLYAGRFEAQKRIDVLLEAFDLVAAQHPTVRLRLVGSGSMIEAVRKQISEMTHQDRVLPQAAVGPNEVPTLINQATIVVLSSDHEGLPMIALEAAQLGRPIVSTDVGGMREVVETGVTGELVPPENPAALANEILRTLDDPVAAEKMGSAAIQRIEDHFSLRACADSYERLYEEVLHEHRSNDTTTMPRANSQTARSGVS